MNRKALVSLALLACVAGVFGQVRHHDFVDFDDHQYLVENPHLRQGLAWPAVARAFTAPHHLNWTPLSTLSLHLDYELHGLDPAGYLLGNAGLHALATLLLFLALARMTGALWPSAFVAAVFAVHPLHVESVAWASQRKDVLAGVFFMAGLLAHAHHAERPQAWGPRTAVLAFLALGLLSKPTVVTFPFVLLLLDAWPLGRLGRRAVIEKLPMIALVILVAAVTYRVQDAYGAMQLGDEIAIPWRLANAVDSCVAYLRAAFWPVGLAPFYPHPRESLDLGRVAAGGLLLLALSVAALCSRRPPLWVGWLWFLGTLVPTLGFVQVGLQARADRYTYLPLVGLAIAVAWGIGELARRSPAARIAAALAGGTSIALLAGAAHVQVSYWSDTVTLFRRAEAVTEANYLAHFTIGNGLRHAGRLDEAVAEYERALEIRPGWTRASNNLAWVLATAPDPALRDPQRAVELAEPLARRPQPDPNHLDTLAAAYAAAGRFDEAIALAEPAARRAQAADRPDLARRIDANLERYRAGRAL